jgi:YVTN family beta-propeller protein
LTAPGKKLYHDVVKARLMPPVPGARTVVAACLFLACAAARGQSVVDSIRLPCPAPLPGGNHCLAYDYNDRLLYVGGDECESLFVIDDRRGAMVGAVAFEDVVVAVYYNPLVNRIYCSTESDGLVYVVEPGTNRVLRELEVDDDILSFVLDSAGNRLFCIGGSGTVPVINCATNVVEGEIELPTSLDIGVAVCYVPPLRRLYVAAESDSVLFVLDCARESLLTTIRLGQEPSALCYNPTNGELYTASWDDTTVKAIDPATNAVIASMSGVGRGAGWLCSNATDNKVYAVGGNLMSIYDGRTDSLKTCVDIGAGTCMSLVWDSRHNAVYTTCGSS